MTITVTVLGMTCDHCVRHVKEALEALPGVSDVTVDLASGNATITSATDLDRPTIEAAVLDAGFTVA